MGLPDETGNQVLRISGGWESTAEDWNCMVKKMEKQASP
jgi:cysteine sulfinate desulfinase/cysteine desulfurase-like protein